MSAETENPEKKMTAAEYLVKLEAGKTQSEIIQTLERKILMGAVLVMMLDDFFVRYLSTKDTCDNASEVELCMLAGQAKAWLLDQR